MFDFFLSCNGFGKFVMILVDGIVYEGVVFVCVFFIFVVDEGLSLMSIDGCELVWIMQLVVLLVFMCMLIEVEFGVCEFMFEICKIVGVLIYVMFSMWMVQIDCGQIDFVLCGEEDIWCLIGIMLFIFDSYGIYYLICDLLVFDKYSCKIFDWFF